MTIRKEYDMTNQENKLYVVKRLVKNGFGLPAAIKIYNELSNNGFYEVEKAELTAWIRKNGF